MATQEECQNRRVTESPSTPPTNPQKPFSARQVAVGRRVVKLMSTINVWLYRRTGGRIGGKFKGGAPVCIVTTTGRKSGQARPKPLLYLLDGDDVILVASQAGMPKHPEWYLNLQANPALTIAIGKTTRHYRAVTVGQEERAALWPRLAEVYPDYNDYQQRTTREIPVVRCSPVAQ